MGLYQAGYMADQNIVKYNVNERTLYHDELRIGDASSSYKEIVPGGEN
jgi:hypothetical protein